VVAGAGRDRVLNANGLITLRGSAVGGRGRASAAARTKYRWRVVARPRGRRPVLRRTASATPRFVPRAPGYYRIRTRVRAPNGSTSFDTATVAVRQDVPPLGWRLDTSDDRGTITLNGQALDKTTWPCASGTDSGCASYVSYATFDRKTLELTDSGTSKGDAAGMKSLADTAAGLVTKPQASLVVVNLSGSSAALPDGKRLLATLGVGGGARPSIPRPMSIVGVPGSPAGSAFISDNFAHCAIANPKCPPLPQKLANMSGYLRLNPGSGTATSSASGGYFEFVFGDQVAFSTDATPGASQITMKVGDQSYTQSPPPNGTSGFFLVMLNSQTRALDHTDSFVTNNADRTERPVEEKRMADQLASAANSGGRLLVLLQAFGRPRGLDGAWLQAAAAIAGLGGNAQVFTQLNQGNAAEPNQGSYALVGRPGMDNRAAESSQSLTGHDGDGKLNGLLMRARGDRYEPLEADPTGGINADLVTIVNRPSPPGGGFPAFAGRSCSPDRPSEMDCGEAKAADVLGRDRDVIGVCPDQADQPRCIRRAYWENPTFWATILSRLEGQAANDDCKATVHGYTEDECNSVRKQFEKEIGARNIVQEYFGKDGLQGPFGGADFNAKFNTIPQITQQITSTLPITRADNTGADVLDILGFVLTGVSEGVGVACEPCGAAGRGLGAAAGLAGYLTRSDGTPDDIGTKVTSAATQLGGELADRYKRISSYFPTEARIVMSDYTKMSEVADKAISSKQWRLPTDPNQPIGLLDLATKQAAYRALVPTAYPVLYDLGQKASGAGVPFVDARSWICKGDPLGFLFDKRLFQNTGPDAQVLWRSSDPRYFGQTHVIAVGAVQTVGSLHSAYVPAPPDSLTAKLFRGPDATVNPGVGFNKLDFYSPPRFRVFPTVLQMTGNGYFEYCHNVPKPPGEAAP
jgi:hypothetical protein